MSTSVPAVTAAGVAAAAARLLAEQGRAGVGEALRLLRDSTRLVGAVLHDAVGDVVTGVAVPHQRGACRTVDVPVRAGERVHGWLTITTDDVMTNEQGAAASSVADVIALALDAAAERLARAAARVEGAQGVLDEEADRAQVAAVLRDRVGDVLVALGYTAEQVAAGRVDPAELVEPVRAALASFRHAHRDLRAHALEGGLRSALREAASRGGGDRFDDGLPMVQVAVDAGDPALDALPPAIAVTVQRVAEVLLRGAQAPVRLRAAVVDSTVKLVAESADIAYDVGELARWERRVRALGGDLWPGPDGVELSLPAASEGSHDDGPDL
jgi:hypothetical protein